MKKLHFMTLQELRAKRDYYKRRMEQLPKGSLRWRFCRWQLTRYANELSIRAAINKYFRNEERKQ